MPGTCNSSLAEPAQDHQPAITTWPRGPMSAESLTYADLAGRLGSSREAARSRARRIKLPRQTANDGTARVKVDPAKIQHKTLYRRSQGSHHPVDFDALKAWIEQLQAEVTKLETEKTATEVIAAGYRADFERERERGDNLLTNTMTIAAMATSARACAHWAGILERLDGVIDYAHLAVQYFCRYLERDAFASVPRSIDIAAGIVDEGCYGVEPVEKIRERAADWAKVVGEERLWLAPSCGFGRHPPQDAPLLQAKIKNMVEAAATF
jgi:methionine synthase II (cobalamin-independent)